MNLSIGLTGLNTAQRAIEVVGTNIANVSTEGYHRQEPVLETMELGSGSFTIGGVRLASVRRSVDRLLEEELLRRRPALGQVGQELSALQTLEASLGKLETEGLGSAMADFFGALRELAADPASQPYREQAVWAANALAGSFHQTGEVLSSLQEHILHQARDLVEQVNGLTEQVASFNSQIESLVMRGGSPNLLVDKRQQVLNELADLIDVQVLERSGANGMVDVLGPGMPLVLRGVVTRLEVQPVEDGKIGLGIEGARQYDTEISGGRLGGLLALRNDLLMGINDDLDAVAGEIIRRVNRAHVQGVGLAGSFSQLTGIWVQHPDEALSEWDAGIAGGEIHLRLISPSGDVARYTVTVDPDADTLESIAASLNALDPAHFSASIVDSHLRLEGKLGYKFDFLPTPELDLGAGWTGTAQPAVSGIYTGAANDRYTFTVVGDGQVGVTPDLSVEVRNSAGELVGTLAVGLGYAAGDRLAVYEGLYASFAPGTLTGGEQFDVTALAESDTSGFLAAAGINTLFQGGSARQMAVRKELLDDSRGLATAAGEGQSDNTVVLAMAAVGEQGLDALDGAAPQEFHRRLVVSLGQKIATRQASQSSLETIMQELQAQQDRISGVDLNDEAARLMVFERMFQAMAKVLGVQKDIMQTVIDLL